MKAEILQNLPSLTAILDGVITHSVYFDIVYCNPAVNTVLGYLQMSL